MSSGTDDASTFGPFKRDEYRKMLGEMNDAEHRRRYPYGCGSRGTCLICHPIDLRRPT